MADTHNSKKTEHQDKACAVFGLVQALLSARYRVLTDTSFDTGTLEELNIYRKHIDDIGVAIHALRRAGVKSVTYDLAGGGDE